LVIEGMVLGVRTAFVAARFDAPWPVPDDRRIDAPLLLAETFAEAVYV